MPSHTRLFRRRRYFIDSSLQGQLIRRILTHWSFFFMAVLLAALLITLWLAEPDTPIAKRCSDAFGQLFLLGLVLLALLPAFALDTIRFSNRFVGPIARLRGAMRQLGGGEIPRRLHFRDNDFWKETADEFNAIIDRVESLRRSCNESGATMHAANASD